MPDLIARGPHSNQRWRRELPSPLSGDEIIIGRSEGDWMLPWDALVSRQHVRVIPRSDVAVEVVVLPQAKNPVFHRGQKASQFTLILGDHFVIGETTLMLVKRPSAIEPDSDDDVIEQTFDPERLNLRRYRNVDVRIEMLSRLPDLVRGSGSNEELLVRVTDVLLKATPDAMAVAIVQVLGEPVESPSTKVEVLHYDSRSLTDEPPPVSARLVRRAVAGGESVLHGWSSLSGASVSFTISEEADWAFCVPLLSDACPGWAIYVTGKSQGSVVLATTGQLAGATGDLQDDVKFAVLVGTMLASIRQSQQLQQRQTAMRQFFAPVVLRALAGQDTSEVLQPREVDLCVMFCDLRGFSQATERGADRLLELLARVSDALGVMTHHILDTGGVIGDFHGDAAMGFWGWPFAQSDAAIRAADAALRIRQEYIQHADTRPFRCGIGIASGRGVAGQIGTVDQVKVTAFGPVVNLASRLETLNKTFGSEVIVDSATAAKLRSGEASRVEFARLRRLARIRPAGMESVGDVYELRPNTPEDQALLSDAQITQYEQSLELLNASQWSAAYEQLYGLPASDRAKDVWVSLVLKHNRTAPPDWDGILRFPLA